MRTLAELYLDALPSADRGRRPPASRTPSVGGHTRGVRRLAHMLTTVIPVLDRPRHHRAAGAVLIVRLQRPDPVAQRVENSWSQIDVQLKRRIDLIPNLVETVKGYAAHERETLDAVIKARNAAMTAAGDPHEQAAADNQLTGALRQVFALSARRTPTSRPTRTSWPCRRS